MATTRNIFRTSILGAILALGLGATPLYLGAAWAAGPVTDANGARAIARVTRSAPALVPLIRSPR